MAERIDWSINSTGPEAYERYIVQAWMGEWARTLVETGDIRQGERVLDVACGTGVVARRVANLIGPNGRVAGLDGDEGMLGVARQLADREGMHEIRWHHCDVSHMPFKPSEYDVLLCQQGLQFFGDRQAALREMCRVTAPGGRLAISVWRSLDHLPFLAVLGTIIGEYLGTDSMKPLYATGSLHNREELRDLISKAGFDDTHIRLEVKIARYPSFQEFLQGFLSIFPIASEISAMHDEDKSEMLQRITTAMDDYMDDDGMAVPMESHIITATKGVG